MKTKHTPGPWRIRTLVGFPPQIATMADSNGFSLPIADCINQNAFNEANARLLAAAPELLAALNALVASLEAKQQSDGLDGFNLIRDFHAARAAIAKAFT